MAYGHSSKLPPWEAPVMITEKRKLLFFSCAAGVTDLVGICQAHLHGAPGMLDGGQRGSSRATVVPTDLDNVGIGLGHSACHCSNASLGHQLH